MQVAYRGIHGEVKDRDIVKIIKDCQKLAVQDPYDKELNSEIAMLAHSLTEVLEADSNEREARSKKILDTLTDKLYKKTID
jgi:hypothetical protein